MDAFTEILSAESVAEVLAGVLERLAESNAVSSETATVEEPAPSIFDAVAPPSITIRMYLRRIVEYVKCSGESIVMALVYIDRLIERRAFAVTALNVHRLLITSILLAAKCFDDEYYSNGFFCPSRRSVSRRAKQIGDAVFVSVAVFHACITPSVHTVRNWSYTSSR